MSTVIDRAKSGQRAAMLRLYEQTASRVYNVAFSLLLNKADAKAAVIRSYQVMWGGLAASNITTEEDFATYAVTTVVYQCKLLMLAKNAKAFRLPADRRFVLGHIPAALPQVDAPAVYGVLAALPELYRLIFVCHTVIGDLSKDDITAITKIDRRTLDVAIEAEKISIANLLKVAADVDAASVEDVAAACASLAVPTDVADAVAADMVAIAAPKEKARRKKTLLTVGIIVGVCVLISGLCAIVLWDMTRPDTTTTSGDDTTASDSADTDTTNAALDLTYSTDYTATHTAEISIQNYGVIKLELDANMAPETVTNFKKLSEQGFYDGLTLHRIMEGFMMQGGCPYGDGTGGAEQNVTGEFAQNGYENTLTHTRGAISMARSNAGYDTGSSQFFIVHEDSTFLDGQYAAFGYVTEGMDVVDDICTTVSPKATDGNGGIPTADQPIIDYVIVTEI